MDTKTRKLIEKVQALYEGATTPGERSAAEAKLNRLMEKHHITFAQLNATLDEKTIVYIKVPKDDDFLKTIFAQCLGVIFNWYGRHKTWYSHRNPNLMGIMVTKAEEKRFRTLFKTFSDGWKKAQADFFEAWIYKQSSILKPRNPDEEPTEADFEAYRRRRGMQQQVKELTDPTLLRLKE